MSRYLITGGAGFIGSNAAHRYLSRGERVTLLDNFSRWGARDNVAWLQSQFGDLVDVVDGDVTDLTTVMRVVSNATVVLHLAGQVAVTTSVAAPMRDFETNVLGTINVLEAARMAATPPSVLYSSTNKVYGALGVDVAESPTRYQPARAVAAGISEGHPFTPASPYGCSKGAADQYVLDYARTFGLRTVVFRQSCIYGPRQFGMEDQGWLAWFALRAMQRRPVVVYGNGKQVRDVLYVSDLLDAYDAAIARIDRTAGEAYNIGGGPANTLSVLELVFELQRRLGRSLEHAFAEWRPGDQQLFISDVSKAKRDFAWSPRTSVSSGLDRLLEWVDQCGAAPVFAAADGVTAL